MTLSPITASASDVRLCERKVFGLGMDDTFEEMQASLASKLPHKIYQKQGKGILGDAFVMSNVAQDEQRSPGAVIVNGSFSQFRKSIQVSHVMTVYSDKSPAWSLDDVQYNKHLLDTISLHCDPDSTSKYKALGRRDPSYVLEDGSTVRVTCGKSMNSLDISFQFPPEVKAPFDCSYSIRVPFGVAGHDANGQRVQSEIQSATESLEMKKAKNVRRTVR